MLCERCEERTAEVHLTKIENEEMVTLHLCSSCAADQGLTGVGTTPAPLADFLATIGSGAEEATQAIPAEPCPYCGTTPDDFRKTGRLGCPQCYPHFEPQLRGLLRRVHGATQHVGKLYLGEANDGDDSFARISSLKQRLDRAVELEDFETAAELRDQIHTLEAAES